MTMPPHPGPLPQGERVLSALHIGRYYRRGRRSSGAGGGLRVSEAVDDGHDRMEAAGSGGARAYNFRGLDEPFGVDGADGDLVAAGLRRGPIVVPDHPCIGGQRQLEGRVLPGPSAVETDPDPLAGLRPAECYAFDQVLLPTEHLVLAV